MLLGSKPAVPFNGNQPSLGQSVLAQIIASLRDGWMWLAVIAGRVHDGEPPVSEAEFAELAAWFVANQDRLYKASLSSQVLEVGNGKGTNVADLRWGAMRGRGSTAPGRSPSTSGFSGPPLNRDTVTESLSAGWPALPPGERIDRGPAASVHPLCPRQGENSVLG